MAYISLMVLLILSEPIWANANSEIIQREINQLDREIERKKAIVNDWTVIRKLASPIEVKISNSKYPRENIEKELEKLDVFINRLKSGESIEIDQKESDYSIFERIYTAIDIYKNSLAGPQELSQIFRTNNLLTPSQMRLAIQAFPEKDETTKLKVSEIFGIPFFLMNRDYQLPTIDGETLYKKSDSKLIISDEYITAFKSLISEKQFNIDKTNNTNFLSSIIGYIDGQINSLNTEIEQYKAQIGDLIKKNAQNKEQEAVIDNILITVALPSLGVLMIALMLMPRFYKSEQLHLTIFTSGVLLELFTVFLLTSTILILGLGGKIQSEVLGTLLGGISGYVLGRSMSSPNKDESSQQLHQIT